MSDIRKRQTDNYKSLTNEKKKEAVFKAVSTLFISIKAEKKSTIDYISIKEINQRIEEAYGLKFSKKFIKDSLEKLGAVKTSVQGKVVYVGIEIRPGLFDVSGKMKSILLLSDSGIIQDELDNKK